MPQHGGFSVNSAIREHFMVVVLTEKGGIQECFGCKIVSYKWLARLVI